MIGHPAFRKIIHPKKRAFLVTYACTGLIAKAAEAAECGRDMHYKWKQLDPDYREAFLLAREMAADLLEDEATRRAMGWDEERIAEDGTSYIMRKYSDTLLIVRLKAVKPEDYRENATVRHEGEVVLALEDRTRHANERLARLRRVGPDPDQLSA